MPKFVAFLRGVSPVNCKMSDLKQALESAGFKDVRTILSSGNVVFGARATAKTALERKIERITLDRLGRNFAAVVWTMDELKDLLERDPFSSIALKPGVKPVITFLRKTPKNLKLPIEHEGVRIFKMVDRVVFTVYTPHPKGPVFMTLIEKTFGKDVTTRTWETLRKVARSSDSI